VGVGRVVHRTIVPSLRYLPNIKVCSPCRWFPKQTKSAPARSNEGAETEILGSHRAYLQSSERRRRPGRRWRRGTRRCAAPWRAWRRWTRTRTIWWRWTRSSPSSAASPRQREMRSRSRRTPSPSRYTD
jgi:hypothetical protein